VIKIADINGLQAFIMGIVGIAMTIGIGMYVLTTFGNSLGECATGMTLNDSAGNCYNATNVSQATATPTGDAYTKTVSLATKLGSATTWIGILILVVFASAVLVYFYNK